MANLRICGKRSTDEVNAFDFTIHVGDRIIRAHRKILSDSLDYFRAMLIHDTAESQTGEMTMRDVSYDAMNSCVRFFYTGVMDIPLEKSEEYLHVANLLQIPNVCEKIEGFLSENVKAECFFYYKRLATTYDMEHLHKACDEYGSKNLSAVANQDEFVSLEKDYVAMLLKECKSKSDDMKLATILLWIKGDLDNRRAAFNDMIDNVDFTKISTFCGRYAVEREEICYENVKFLRALYLSSSEKPSDDSYTFDQVPYYQNSIIAFDKRSRSLNYIYRLIKHCDNATIHWQKVPVFDINIWETYFTAVAVGTAIYIFASKTRRTVELIWQDEKASWLEKEHLHMLHDHGGYIKCLKYKDQIYVVGNGLFEKSGMKNDLEWINITVPPNSCNSCAIEAVGDYIYLIGGLEGNTSTNRVYRFDPFYETWTAVLSMSYPRSTPGVCTLRGKIYVAGGYCYGMTSVFEVYDPNVDQWTTLSSMNKTRSPLGLVTCDGRIYACGSYKKDAGIEEYNPEYDDWRSYNISFPKHFIAAATIAVNAPLSWLFGECSYDLDDDCYSSDSLDFGFISGFLLRTSG